MSVQEATESQQSKLSKAEIAGFRTILGPLQLNELITLMRTITRSRRTNVDTHDEAIARIIKSAGSAIDILGRQKVTKVIIFDYLMTLHENGELPLPPNKSMSKLELSNMCLKFWNSELFEESNQVYRDLVEAFVRAFHTPQNPDLDDHQNGNQYYKAFRHLIWEDKCQLHAQFINNSTGDTEDIMAHDYNGVTRRLFFLKNVIKMEFNLNDDRDSFLMGKDRYNSIIINIPGNCRIENNSGGLELVLKYSGKCIDDIKFTVDGLNITEALTIDIGIDDLTWSLEDSQINEVTHVDQDINE